MILRHFVASLFLLAMSTAHAGEPATWSGVERIVAVGDVHGDYDQFRQVLLDAGIINKRNKWIGGQTHLVQVGDVPDRGPDTRKAMDLLMKLEKQARRKGGYVHALIGNHESLNVVGDLRYVHPGEYEAFAGRQSQSLQTAYLDASIEHLRNTLPEEDWPVFDEAFEDDFRKRFPLGYVEHRRAWAPAGKYGAWVLTHNTVIRINDTLFVHGGLSGKYADLSIDDINERIRAELSTPDALGSDAMIDDDLGPLWYRGLAINDDELASEREQVEAMLAARNAKRIIIAHTPLTGAIVPRFDAKVIDVDVGLSAHYGGRLACLVIEGDDVYALHRGTRLDLPEDNDRLSAYLEKAAALDPTPSPVTQYIEKLARAKIEPLQPPQEKPAPVE